MKTIKARLTFTEGLLGTASSDPEIYDTYIASKAENKDTADELEGVERASEEQEEKSITVFARNKDGEPILWNYHIKGFFKDTCSALRKVTGTKSSKIKAFKKEIDGLIFAFPREIVIHYDGEITTCQRSLRASTPQGERTALACSEEIPAGAWIEVEIKMLSDAHEAVVREWLDYGELKGLGQWRNSGKGRFKWEEID